MSDEPIFEQIAESDIAQEYYAQRKCFACGTEYDDREPVMVCGECFHRWYSEQELVVHDMAQRANTAEQGEYTTSRPFKDIDMCPCCAHDF